MRILKVMLLIFILTGLISCNQSKKLPKAINGVLDLRNWDFEKDGNIELRGDWEFYWKQFLSAKDFDTIQTRHFIQVPKPWNGYKWGNEEIGYEGYATYRLRILVNNKIKDFGLKFPDQGTAFELYLNDSMVGKNGIIGKSRETVEPQYRPLLIPFQYQKDTIELVCFVSNFDFHFGGIYFMPVFGSDSKAADLNKKSYLKDYILAEANIIAAFIMLIFFILRPGDKISLSGLFFVAFSFLRTITVNERIIDDFLPALSWEWRIKLEALSWMLVVPAGTFVVRHLYRSLLTKRFLYIMNISFGLTAFITILTPAYINTQLIQPAQYFSFIILMNYWIIYTKALIRRLEGSIIIYFCWLFVFSGCLNEALYYDNLISKLYIGFPVGCAIYIFGWLIILARKFTHALKRVEHFASELEITVEERTKELKEEKEKSDNLLLNVLPEPIANRLKEGETPIADHFEEASIIFIDIADFTKMSQMTSPQSMVKELNKIFTVFDKISSKYGLEKIKTIGDCYMAAAGIPEPRQDHAEAVASMAMEVMEVMKGYKTDEGFDIRFRIGLDCGPIVAGVIGEQKFIYDLWGDPVNTASRMEYFGVIGKVQCTTRFKDKLEISHKSKVVSRKSEEDGSHQSSVVSHQSEEINSDFQFIERGEIEVKGKGVMRTWFLEAKKESLMEEV